jgi:hypothetical protein
MKTLKWKVIMLLLLIMIATITVVARQTLKADASKASDRGVVIACGK